MSDEEAPLGPENLEEEEEEEEEEGGEGEEEGGEEGREQEEGEDLDPEIDAEEEEESTDEEVAAKIAQGFIVDDDDELDEEEENEKIIERKPSSHHHRKKKRKRDRVESEVDESDLELLEENTGVVREKFKRIKRGLREHDDESSLDEPEEAIPTRRPDISRIFDDNEELDYEDMNNFVVYDDEDIEDRDRGRSRHPDEARMDGEAIYDEKLEIWQDLFGDDQDYAWAYDGPDRQTEQEKVDLKDVLEPSEVKARMLTESDESIRNIDLPERMLTRQAINPTRRLESNEIEEESKFVMKILSDFHDFRLHDQTVLKKAIMDVLCLLSQEFVEVPYIYHQCRDRIAEINFNNYRISDTLTLDDLWMIYDLDIKFRAFLEYREQLRQSIEKYEIQDIYVEELIGQAESIEELKDINEYVNIIYSEKGNKSDSKSRKPRSNYRRLKENGIHRFAKLFGVDSQAFASNLRLKNKIHFPNDPHMMVNLAAEDFLKATENTLSERELIDGAKLFTAHEIAYDPYVKKAVREWYLDHSFVKVRPTQKGATRIDPEHQYYPFKFLNKPVQRFIKTGQFLQIIRSELDGLTTVSLELDNTDAYIEYLANYIISDSVSEIGDAWNSARRDIVKIAVEEILGPSMEKWLRSKLQTEGEDWIANQCYKSLERKIDLTPFTTQSMDEDTVPSVVALSFGYGTRDSLVECVYVNDEGKVADVCNFSNLKDDTKDREALLRLLHKKKPDVIAIAGYDINTRRLLEQVRELVKEHSRKHHDDVYVTVVNDEVANLAKKSKKYQDEFAGRGFSELKLYCVSLARLLQSPITEYATLDRALLHIRHHPLQELVPSEQLKFALERAIINVVNANGIDILDMLDYPEKAHTLQYVSGLGPRKAQNILKRMRQLEREIESREDFHAQMVGDKVYQNCASFLRFSSDSVEPLDRTRIHPSDYELARKMAADALDIDNEEIMEESKRTMVIRDVMRRPSKLNDLILEEYGEQLKKIYGEPRRITMFTIRQELSRPYRDLRRDFPKPTVDEIFELITKETSETLETGMIVPAEIYRVEDRFAKARLHSGLDAIIGSNYILDPPDLNSHHHSHTTQADVTSYLHEGQVIDAAVVQVDKIKFQAVLSIRPKQIAEFYEKIRQREVEKDPFFDNDAAEKFIKRQVPKRLLAPTNTRTINHPLFSPMNYKEAEAYLASRQIGDLIIRPSSQGNNHIAVTWKVGQDLYQHIDVEEVIRIEKSKPLPQNGRASAKGPNQPKPTTEVKVLKVGSYEYSDLDELIVSHIEASARKIADLAGHPKFRQTKEELVRFFEDSMHLNPKQAVYGFCLDPENPGRFEIAFKIKPDKPIQHWQGKVTPDGFKLYGIEYPDVLSLINGFKKLQINRYCGKI